MRSFMALTVNETRTIMKVSLVNNIAHILLLPVVI